MKQYFLLLLPLLFANCSKNNETSGEDVLLGSTKDEYYVRYSADYCSYHTHYIKYRDTNGELISQSFQSSDEVFFEVGPVSPIFQAYIEGNQCTYSPTTINIYVRKNNQAYIKVATQSVMSRYPSGYVSLNYNLREYD